MSQSKTEPLLVIEGEMNDLGYYPVRFWGRDYALCSELRPVYGSQYDPYHPHLEMQFSVIPVPPRYEPGIPDNIVLGEN